MMKVLRIGHNQTGHIAGSMEMMKGKLPSNKWREELGNLRVEGRYKVGAVGMHDGELDSQALRLFDLLPVQPYDLR